MTGSFAFRAAAHDEPTSFIDLHLTAQGMEATLTASATDLAHDLSGVEPAMLLDPAVLLAHRNALSAIILPRLSIEADGVSQTGEIRDLVSMPEKRDVRFSIYYPWPKPPARLVLNCALFPYDARHRTFLNVYEGGELLRQEIFGKDSGPKDIGVSSERQSAGMVIRQFVVSGVHHIFIGPDHILFVVGLLLLGGGLRHLLKIVTAFTIAHSITLGLAAFRILSPPASVIEPAIALSIVFVGTHALFGRNGRDPRILFAFCFGLIHGFGFANVLQEMKLPRHALGWSLFAFNGGVEIGQACIVLAVAPLLAFIRKRSLQASLTVTASGSLLITAAGAFWFFQRILN